MHKDQAGASMSIHEDIVIVRACMRRIMMSTGGGSMSRRAHEKHEA